MKSINDLVKKNLKLNKKRTFAIIFGIALSVALIYTMLAVFTNTKVAVTDLAFKSTGRYHVKLLNQSKEDYEYYKRHNKIAKVLREGRRIDYVSKKDEYVYTVIDVDKEYFKNFDLRLKEGRYPKNNNEILLRGDEKTRNDKRLNDLIKVDHMYYGDSSKEINKTYKVVGFYEEDYYPMLREFSIFEEKVNDYQTLIIELKDPSDLEEFQKEIKDKGEIENFLINEIYYEFYFFKTPRMIFLKGLLIFFIIIVLISAFVIIKNSFDITFSERVKQISTLSSIGASKKQIKSFLYKEAFIVTLIAYALGILIAYIATFILSNYVSKTLTYLMDLKLTVNNKLNLLALIVSFVLIFITVYFSLIKLVRKYSKNTIMESIRNKDLKVSKKTLKDKSKLSFLGPSIFLANRNLKVNKKKYFSTVISITISVILFITMNFMINNFKHLIDVSNRVRYPQAYYLSSSDEEEIKKFREYSNKYFKGEDKLYFRKIYLSDIDEKYLNTSNTNRTIAVLEDSLFKKLNLDKNKLYIYNYYLNIDRNNKIKEIKLYKENLDNIEFIFGDNKVKLDVAYLNKNKVKKSDLKDITLEADFFISDSLYDKKIKDIYNEVQMAKYYFNLGKDKKYIIQNLKFDNAVFSDDTAIYKKIYTLIKAVKIFLYGFIIVITIIAITNIFNVINSNINSRKSDFASLRSIGITDKEFNKMILFESAIYTIKSLLIGIIISLVLTSLIQSILGKYAEVDFYYKVPLFGIIFSVIVVFLIILITMFYSISKVKKQNIIETIRNENI